MRASDNVYADRTQILSDFRQIVADSAERLRRLEVRGVVYFHCDHFEPWDFSRQPPERAAEQVIDFVDAVQRVDFARRLTLFYSNPWSTRLSEQDDLRRAAADDRLGFVPRSEADHETLGAPFRYLRAHSGHEIQIHIHHENFTRTRGMRDPQRAAYLNSERGRGGDGLRLECAVEQWLESARREFDYVPERWFFVHGLWALNGSDPEGCTIHDEIARLMKWGCRGDFTFPAGRPHCDPRFEAPYFCAPAIGPKSYDSEAASPEFAWGNSGAAAEKFFIWNSPIKAAGASLDWGDPGLRRRLERPEPFAREIIEASFRWDGVLFIKTHAHSMHHMNRDDDGLLVHPHCYGPTRDLYGAIFEAAGAAGATVTLATAGEVYDRFVEAQSPADRPPMSAFRPSLAGKTLRHVEPTSERVLETAAELDGIAVATLTARIAELGVDGSGAESHYASLAARGSLLPKHDLRAAQILLSQFAARHAVHEIGSGVGMLPLLLAALGVPALGIERSQRRYDASRAIAAAIARYRQAALAPHDFLLGRFPECIDGVDLSNKVSVITDFTCTMTAEERQDLMWALRGYGAVLLDLDRFVRRIGSPEERQELIAEFRRLGFAAIYDAEISADFAFILLINSTGMLSREDLPSGVAAAAWAENRIAASNGGDAAFDVGVSAAGSPEPLRIALSPPFEQELEYCWTYRLGTLAEAPALANMADFDAEPAQSPARFYEDGKLLGPAHAAHAQIRKFGGGVFSHWKDRLYFSTSDNSDPNRNGRNYELVVGREDKGFEAAAAEASLAGVPKDPASDEARPDRVLAGREARSGQSLFHLTGFEPDGGFAVVAKLAIPGDGEENPHSSSLVLFEDGVVLGPPHAPHAAIRDLGLGRYSHWSNDIYFSSSDGSDPRANGRAYDAYMPGEAGQSAAASHAIEALRRLPASYAPEEAYAAVETALAALYPKAVLGDPNKAFWHDTAFTRAYRRVCGRDRRAMERKYTVYQLVKALYGIAGEIAECGTRNGETAYFIALAGREIGRERPLRIFDSFEGLSQPTEYDGAFWTAGALAAPETNLRRNLGEFDDIHIYKGWIPSRFPEIADRRFCLVHVDVDLFVPTRDSVAFFYDRLEPGGILLCDDYGSTLCPGARKAMDEFFGDRPEHVIDLPSEQGFIIKS